MIDKWTYDPATCTVFDSRGKVVASGVNHRDGSVIANRSGDLLRRSRKSIAVLRDILNATDILGKEICDELIRDIDASLPRRQRHGEINNAINRGIPAT